MQRHNEQQQEQQQQQQQQQHQHQHQQQQQQQPQHQGGRPIGVDGGVYFDQQQQHRNYTNSRIVAQDGGGRLPVQVPAMSSKNMSSSSSSTRRLFTWSKVVTTGPSNLYNTDSFSLTGLTAISSTSNLNLLPPPRSGAASVVVKGKLYVFGGYGGGTGRLDDFWSYDYTNQKWEEVTVVSAEKPGCRENNGVVISDSSRSIYLFGGYNGSAWLNDLWEFNIETKRWTCIQESTDIVCRDNLLSAINNDTMNVDAAAMPPLALFDAAGGNNNMNNTTTLAVQGKIPSRRFGYVSVVHDGKLLVFGGFDGSRWLNDMYVFHFQTKVWTEIQARGVLPSARSCPAWAKDDTHVYIHGGYDGVERKSDFFSFDLTTYTWNEMLCLGVPPSPRYFHSCCLYNRKMYVYGGYSGSERLAEMFCYDFDTHHWSQIDCTVGDAPAGRSSLVAQVYENCIYIFGGYNGSTVLNDFYRFQLKAVDVAPPSLISDFQRLINNAELADVQFIVENKPIYAHRAVLAIRSEYFRVMLCGGMRESSMVLSKQPASDSTMSSLDIVNADNDDQASSQQQQQFVHHQAIELPDISYSVFLKVLEFLYTDSVGTVTLEVGINLLIASEQFMLDRLKGLCEDIIRGDISTDTVVSILVTSHRHHAVFLKDIALEYILNNLNDPSIMSGLAELKAEPDLLLEIIRRNTINQQMTAMSPGGNFDVNGTMSDGSVASASSINNNNIAGPFGLNADWNARR